MWSKLLTLMMAISIVSSVSVPVVSAMDEQASTYETYEIDKEILGMQKTMKFFQELSSKKGNHQLANQIADLSSSNFEKVKQLHANENVKATDQNLKEFRDAYEQQIASYREKLLPSLNTSTPLLNKSSLVAKSSTWDPFEPNDDYTTSYPITSGNLYVSKLSSSSDVDYYRFDSGSMVGSLTVTMNIPSDKDYDLIVIEGTSNIVGYGMKSQLGLTETVDFQVQPNTTYYIMVMSMDGQFSTTSTYSLGLSKVVAELKVTTPIDISLPSGEIPAYRFTAPVSGNYRFFTGPYGGFGSQNDTVIFLFADEQLKSLIDINDDKVEGSLYSEINIELTKGVTYFVYVTNYDEEQHVHTRLTAVFDAKADVSTTTIHESNGNNGSILEEQVVILDQGEFTSDLADGVVVNNLPAGLTTEVTRNSNTQFTIRFKGSAYSHESKHSVSDASVTIAKEKILGAGMDVNTSAFGIQFVDTEQISVNTSKEVNIDGGQQKILKFTPTMSGSFEVYLTEYEGNVNHPILSIFEDYNQTRLIASNDKQTSSPQVIGSLSAGEDYYVVIAGENGENVHARIGVRYLGMEYIYNEKGQLTLIKQGDKVLTEFYYDGNGNLIRKVNR
ncbi:hypothetical protein [Brevibacillus invocatus]|uniref:hypothetical protein n=1 Tax=Brevibacillus invocatus TaxID=173959 RepID=UPI00203C4AE1|nr:hypothetical protein [Brevibacillus invocatus]MCM3432548.1 hypothetical protein [Brevibacillus invocatus]